MKSLAILEVHATDNNYHNEIMFEVGGFVIDFSDWKFNKDKELDTLIDYASIYIDKNDIIEALKCYQENRSTVRERWTKRKINRSIKSELITNQQQTKRRM